MSKHFHDIIFIAISSPLLTFVLLLEIWDALRVAAEADLGLAQAIVDGAGVIVQNPDLTICYDERGSRPSLDFASINVVEYCLLIEDVYVIAGAKYELPKYVLSEPTNLIIQHT